MSNIALTESTPGLVLNPCSKCGGTTVRIWVDYKSNCDEIVICANCGAKVIRRQESPRTLEESWNRAHPFSGKDEEIKFRRERAKLLAELNPETDFEYLRKRQEIVRQLEQSNTTTEDGTVIDADRFSNIREIQKTQIEQMEAEIDRAERGEGQAGE
jgi:hypothetical protein